jgi:hypothetical protein
MPRRLPIRLCIAAVLLGIEGCSQLPPDYSPHYGYVPVVSPQRPDRIRYVLVPDACRVADPTDPGYFGPLLPPGCANAYNLQRMAERERDLVRGRPLGAAPAAPSVRAAQKYLYGAEGPLGGATGRPGLGGGTAPSTSVEPQQVRKP